MNKKEVGMLLDEVAIYYPSFVFQQRQDDKREIRDKWHKVLEDTPYDIAVSLLEVYVRNPDNRYAPHPGALRKVKSDAERYHEQMQAAGILTIEHWEEMKKNAVGPTEEQRRKVREILGRNV